MDDRRERNGRWTQRGLGALVVAAAVVTGARADGAAEDAALREARAAAMELGGKLKGQLESALKSGGPTAAMAVCQTAAPAIARESSAHYDGDVGRTALRLRNPANAPDPYERATLERFVAAAADGADVATLEHAEIVDEHGRRVFRYMKAIPMQETPCATCHGVDVAAPVRDEIRARYPADEATGFRPGDVRGAFTVMKTLR